MLQSLCNSSWDDRGPCRDEYANGGPHGSGPGPRSRQSNVENLGLLKMALLIWSIFYFFGKKKVDELVKVFFGKIRVK